jgi:hypothetical protein
LEEIEMTPAPARPVVNALRARASGRAIKLPCLATDFKIDALLYRVEVNLRDLPWGAQTEGIGEQGFDGAVHGGIRYRQWQKDIDRLSLVKFHWKRHRNAGSRWAEKISGLWMPTATVSVLPPRMR